MTPVTLTIPAAGTQSGVGVYQGHGKYFLLTATTGAFRVITSTHDEYSISETGFGFGNDSSPAFGKLTFYNDGGAPVTITFYVSMTLIKTPDASITSTITVTASLTNTLAQDALESEGQFQVTWNSGGAVRFQTAGTYFRRAVIIAQSSLDRAANTGTVAIGNSSGHQPISLAPGAIFEIEADTGGKRDFGSWYLLGANADDGVSVLYV